jgi:hypothetical protein
MATTAKNAYEIRSDLLGLAKDIADFNYSAKIQEYEYSIRKDGDQVVQEFKAPTLKAEDIIETAKKFNEFVTNGDNFNTFKDVGQKMYEEGLKNAKPFSEAYQSMVSAFYPHLNKQSK